MEAGLRSEGCKKKDAALPGETHRDTECVKETALKANSTAHAPSQIARKKGLSQPNNATYRPRI
jgi:hypothetical protein